MQRRNPNELKMNEPKEDKQREDGQEETKALPGIARQISLQYPHPITGEPTSVDYNSFFGPMRTQFENALVAEHPESGYAEGIYESWGQEGMDLIEEKTVDSNSENSEIDTNSQIEDMDSDSDFDGGENAPLNTVSRRPGPGGAARGA